MNGVFIASFIEALGWMLLHFIWQAPAIAGLLWCFLRTTRNATAQLRYVAACAALLLMLMAGMTTFARSFDFQRSPQPQSIGIADPQGVTSTPTENRLPFTPIRTEATSAFLHDAVEPDATTFSTVTTSLRPWLSWIVGLWTIGVAFHSVQFFAGWRFARRMRAEGRAVENSEWIERFDRLREHLGVSIRVRLLSSASATVPMVIGFLKPVVLIPTSLLTGLSTSQVESILVHELTHIRRHDYLVNLLQNVAETLFFYQPALWWVSGQIRQEREHCCDDAASAFCGNSLDYARALAALEELRSARAAQCVAASGGSLLERIRRITRVRETRQTYSLWPVSLALLIAVAVVTPLSMLPATAENEVPPPADVITVSVRNSADGKPLPAFRLIAGTPAGEGRSGEVNNEAAQKFVNWQPHTAREGTDGSYSWPLKKAYDLLALRVEADGFKSQTVKWIKKSDGPKTITVELIPDPGLAGRVLNPDGAPAAGATIAIALPQRNIMVRGGTILADDLPVPAQLGERWRRPMVAKADAEGRFHLPTESDPAAVVLFVHESGVHEMASADLKENGVITLKRWGRVEGRVLWRDKPGANERIKLSYSRDDYGYPGMIGGSEATQTDGEGQFIFEKVLPGRVQISRPVPESAENSSKTHGAIFEGFYVHVDVASGPPTPVQIGDQGRKIVGRFTGRDSWEGVTFHVHPNAPHVGFQGDNERWKAFGELKNSAIGPLYFRDNLKPNADGNFEIAGLPPGRYQLFVTAPNVNNYAGTTEINVPPEKPGVAPAQIDIGQVAVKAPRKDEPKAPNTEREFEKLSQRRAAMEPAYLDAVKKLNVSMLPAIGRAELDPKVVKLALERQRVWLELDPREALADEYLDFEQRFRGDALALESLHCIMRDAASVGSLHAKCRKARVEAIDRMVQHYLAHEMLAPAFISLGSGPPAPNADDLLQAAVEESPHRGVRAAALMSQVRLARERLRQLETAPAGFAESARVSKDPEFKKFAAPLLAMDASATQRTALARLQIVATQYADVPHNQAGTYGNAAAYAKSAMEEVVRGKPAPEVTAQDVAGRPFRLSSLRGKVVVLTFCISNGEAINLPLQNLAAKFGESDAEFVTVVIVHDQKRFASAVAKELPIGTIILQDPFDGAMRMSWGVDHCPTTFIVDSDGKLADRPLRKLGETEQELERDIRRLLK